MSKFTYQLKLWVKDLIGCVIDFLDGIEDISKRDYHDEESCEVVCYFRSDDLPFMLDRDLYMKIPVTEFTAYMNGTIILSERGSYNRPILSDVEPSQYSYIELKREANDRIKVIHRYTPGVPWGV